MDHTTGKVELSLRLSHVDPEKASRLRKKQRKGAVQTVRGKHERHLVVSDESDSDESVSVVSSDER